jgi:Uma2 family endonuclease
MTVTTTRMGLEDFFAYTSDLDTFYELEDGELFEMLPESDLNQRIASFLFAYFLRQGIAPDRLRTKTEIAVMGVRTTVRVPDLLVLSEELATALEGATRATITLDMPPPRLVVEVVSPGRRISTATTATSDRSTKPEALSNTRLLTPSLSGFLC